MIDISEIISSHTVRVDGGSGVLINPAEGDFSYIITAKHVIELGDKYKSHQDIVVKNLVVFQKVCWH